MARKTTSLFAAELVRPAVTASFRKLHPRTMAKNPVMFVTMVGALLTTLCIPAAGDETGFVLQLALWLPRALVLALAERNPSEPLASPWKSHLPCSE